MHKALVLSVPGTGTRFTMNYLMGCLGYEKLSPEDLLHKPENSPFCALQHVNAAPPILRELAEHPGLKTVIPLRAPVYQFITRSGEAAHANRVREESKMLWARLRQLKEDFDYVYLPIEEDMNRHRRLMKVADHLDAVPAPDVFEEITAHWAKVGSSGVKPARVKYDRTGSISIGGISLSCLDEEMAWYAEIIKEYRKGL